MYIYKIQYQEVTRKEFVRFLSEECVYDLNLCGCLAIRSANYKAGERETRRMQAEARRDYMRKVEYGRNFKYGTSNVLHCGVKNGSVEVDYCK